MLGAEGRLRLVGLLYGVTVLVIACGLALLIGTVGVLPFMVLPRGRREKFAIVAAALWCDVTVRGLLMTKVQVTGELELGRGKGALFLCNHRSWLDPLVMIAWTYSQGLSKAEIFWIPFVGLFAWLTGAVFFDRRSPKQRQKARDETMWLVRQGARVHVFPEGTRSRDGEIGAKVYLTLPMDCFAAGVPVVPCAVYRTERVLPPTESAAWPLQTVRLDIGRPMYPKDFPDADTFAKACWAETVRRFEAMRRAS